MRDLRQRFGTTEWNRAKINETIKSVMGDYKLKLPKIAMPLRVAATGTTHTPPIDATLELIGRDEVVARLDKALRG
jgi:glutamyl-tRNA synthetase